MNLSTVILSKNEEENIKECIESVSFCDEVILVDDNSIDKTRQIAKNLGAKIFIRSLDNDFAAQRNFGLEKARGSWVLFVDADERVPISLKEEILKKISDSPGVMGYFVRRSDILFGRSLKYGETGNVRLLRLARRAGGKWRRKVHEFWDIIGRTQELFNPLLHYPHPSLREFLSEVNWMSSLHAEENKKEGKRSNLLKILIWPKIKFIDNYIIKLGFLDGDLGFIVALMMSIHSFLAWGKLWFLQKETR